MKQVILLVILVCSQLINAQDLSGSRIRKIADKKQSVYFDSGIFHLLTGSGIETQLDKIRHSVSKEQASERLVFDFTTSAPPKIYGSIVAGEKKIHIDLFDTKINPNVASIGNSDLIEDIKVFPFDNESLTLEIELKKNCTIDVFVLEGPGD